MVHRHAPPAHTHPVDPPIVSVLDDRVDEQLRSVLQIRAKTELHDGGSSIGRRDAPTWAWSVSDELDAGLADKRVDIEPRHIELLAHERDLRLLGGAIDSSLRWST
jgi:hypothetical protein